MVLYVAHLTAVNNREVSLFSLLNLKGTCFGFSFLLNVIIKHRVIVLFVYSDFLLQVSLLPVSHATIDNILLNFLAVKMNAFLREIAQVGRSTVAPRYCDFCKDRFMLDQQLFSANYDIVKPLREGDLFTVYAGQHKIKKSPVRIKTVYRRSVCNEELCAAFKIPREVKMLQKVKSVNGAIKLLEYYVLENCYVIVMERSRVAMSMANLILRMEYIPEIDAKFFFRQIVDIVRNCYESGVVLQNINPGNIFVNLKNFRLTLIDFSSATLYKDTLYKNFKGTPSYRPPEWIRDRCYYECNATVWTLGVLLYKMVTGKRPFTDDKEIFLGEVHFARNVSQECQDLVKRCLTLDPWDRPCFEEILQHPWM